MLTHTFTLTHTHTHTLSHIHTHTRYSLLFVPYPFCMLIQSVEMMNGDDGEEEAYHPLEVGE